MKHAARDYAQTLMNIYREMTQDWRAAVAAPR